MAESDEKTFFQGPIMVAGSFLHYVRHECRGAKELLDRSIDSLRAGMVEHPEINSAGDPEDIGQLASGPVT